VNDGSNDDSGEKVKFLMQSNPSIKYINLSRNFGQHAAMFAGMANASGNYVCALDCDLEEAPENLAAMYKRIKGSQDIDVVYGVLKGRTGGLFRKTLGGFFYNIMDFLSHVKIPRDQAWQRLMTKQYVQALLLHTEKESLPAGLMVLAGFNQVPFQMEKIYKGTSSYSVAKRWRLAVNSITSFSSRPLTLICLLGLGITICAAIGIISIIGLKLTSVDFQAGWLSLVASIWLVGGMILASVGVVGIYIAKIFDQVKPRPLYIIKDIEISKIFL